MNCWRRYEADRIRGGNGGRDSDRTCDPSFSGAAVEAKKHGPAFGLGGGVGRTLPGRGPARLT
jgi:hypothetical protein